LAGAVSRNGPAAGPQVSSVLVGDLPKSAKHMLIVEFSDLVLRRRGSRFNRFTSSNAAINENGKAMLQKK
jgi:hypothetical protein